LSVDKNMNDSSVVYDDTDVLTALYGYGGNVGKSQTTGDDKTEELTFKDVVWTATSEHPAKPAEQTYIEDPAATALYGRNGRARFGFYQNGDIDDAEVLLEKTWEALQATSKPKISITGSVSDLYRLGYADQPLRLHDAVIVEVRQTGEKFEKEIIKLDVDLIDPTATRPEIGDYIPNIIYINREANKTGGGGGGRGQNKEEYDDATTYSALEKTNEMIGMVVGTRNGENYIKAGEIALSINAQTGETKILLSADIIDIEGVVEELEAFDVTVHSLSADNVTVGDDGGVSISDGYISVEEGTVSAETVEATYLEVGETEAEWQSETIPTFTYSNQHSYVYKQSGVEYTVLGYIIGTKGTKTIHYLGSETT
jgi:hypothetical protein